MSGLEVVIIVGGAIYVTKKVRERRERKRLERDAALLSEHGVAQLSLPPTSSSSRSRPRQQTPIEEEEALPLYRAPTERPPNEAGAIEWPNSIHLPTYDELSKGQAEKAQQQGEGALSRVSSNDASPSTPSSSSSRSTSPSEPLPSEPTRLVPPMPRELPPREAAAKKRKFWRRSSSAKAAA